MEVTIRRDDEARLLFLTVTGDQTLEETLALEEQIAKSGAWGFRWLIDERNAHVHLSSTDIRTVFARGQLLTATYGPRGPVAVVAGAVHDYGVDRMASAYADIAGVTFEAFTTIEEAEAWLRQQVSRS